MNRESHAFVQFFPTHQIFPYLINPLIAINSFVVNAWLS